MTAHVSFVSIMFLSLFVSDGVWLPSDINNDDKKIASEFRRVSFGNTWIRGYGNTYSKDHHKIISRLRNPAIVIGMKAITLGSVEHHFNGSLHFTLPLRSCFQSSEPFSIYHLPTINEFAMSDKRTKSTLSNHSVKS